jgi:hypothetical protein
MRMRTYKKTQSRQHICVAIPVIPLVREQHQAVEHPGECWSPSRPSTYFGNHVVNGQYYEDLNGICSMQADEKEGGKEEGDGY